MFTIFVPMKRILPLLLGSLLVACGGEGNNDAVDEISENYSEGKKVYEKTCIACHQENGEGLEGSFPPLANSDYMLEDTDRAIEQVLNGSSGEITVNGKVYNGTMPPQALNDQEVMDVMNYVLNSWGNDGGEVTLEQVKSADDQQCRTNDEPMSHVLPHYATPSPMLASSGLASLR